MDDSKNEKRSLKIIEWNIAKKTCYADWKKIEKNIKEKAPDILVLTECNTRFTDCVFQNRLEEFAGIKWKILTNENDRTFNYIAVLVNTNSNIEVPESSTSYAEDTSKPHPDRVAVDITFKDNPSKSIRILGIRMLTSWYNKKLETNYPNSNLSAKEKQLTQNIQLIKDIQKLNPDIIIGDFNTNTEMEKPGFYNGPLENSDEINQDLQNSWNELLNSDSPSESPALNVFCQCISKDQKSYEYWAGDNNSFSVKAKRSNKKAFATSPDVLIWNSKRILIKEKQYFPDLRNHDTGEIRNPSDVVEDWPSDHCMLIADIKVK